MLGGRTLLYKSCGARFAHEAHVTCAKMIFTSAWQVQQLKARVAELEPYKVKYENIQATTQHEHAVCALLCVNTWYMLPPSASGAAASANCGIMR